MVENLKRYIEENQLFDETHKVLVAVSGGIDSMVLLHMLRKAGYAVSVAHCNFNLRGQESDGDEAFVKNYCQKEKLTLHNETFNTADVADETGESIQMAARRLRYTWFDALCITHGYSAVATAHHANDVAETFFVNLSRGTGLAGLTGIKPKHGNVVRPLLFAQRADIEAYAIANKISWRDDSSNQSVKYRRNRIRHEVIPVFNQINPAFNKSIITTIQRLEQANTLLKNYMATQLADVMAETGSRIFVSIDKLKELKPLSLYLFEIVHSYGFNAEQVDELEQALGKTPGARFYSTSHELIRDREFLIIQPKEEKHYKHYSIDAELNTTYLPVKLKAQKIAAADKLHLVNPPTVALLDMAKLAFPLTLRKPQQGDKFKPFGMQTHKLLSDFFKDSKLSAAKKEDAWVLVSGHDIIWVVGYRIDDRFAVKPTTSSVLRLEMEF